MNKFILIAVFFGLLISLEVVITAFSSEAFGVYMLDLTADAEGEKDVDEKSEEDKNIELQLYTSAEEDDILSITLIQIEGSIFSKPYLDQATPPPEA